MKIKPQETRLKYRMTFLSNIINQKGYLTPYCWRFTRLFEIFYYNFYSINFIQLQLLFLSVKTMKNLINLKSNPFQNGLNGHHERINKSPRSKNQIQFYSSPPPETIIDFHFGRYPFQNKQVQGNRFLKTTVACAIEERRLQKLMNTAHPHLINIRKIVRGHPKQPMHSHASTYFSFFYEAVPYSLKRMAALSESQGRIMSKLGNINFAIILKDLSEYLMNNGVYHEIKLDDIGVDEQFNIKIYLSPTIACGLDKVQSTKQSIIKNNQILINWWNTTFSFTQTTIESNTLNIPRVESFENLDRLAAEMIKSNKSSFTAGENSQIMGQVEEIIENIDQMKISMPEENFKNLNFSNNIGKVNSPIGLTSSIKQNPQVKNNEGLPSGSDLKCSQKTFKSQISRLSQLQQTKMKKIHDEVEKIKKNVKKSSMDHRLRKQSDHIILEKIKAFNKTVNHNQKQIFQSAKLQKTKVNPEIAQKQQNKYSRESIQQNINCINIYNQSPNVANKHNHILSVPVFSYNIIPVAGQQQRTPVPHRISQRIIEQPTNDRSNTDNGSNTSFEIDDHKMVGNSIAFRHSLEPSDDHPLLNMNIPTEKSGQSKSKQIKVTTKNVTESAGPLQFKSIINKFIKPQFMAKKSNIYEDPHEDQSEHQVSKHENVIKQSQKLPPNKQEKTENNKKSSERQKQKHQSNILKSRLSKVDQQSGGNDMINNSLGKMNNLMNQKSQTNLLKKAKTHEDSLNSRIREVVLKTKNAIELLNRVKSSKSINRRNVSP